MGQQPLAGAIHQSQALFAIEGENGHIDLRHNRTQQGSRLERAQALLAQGLPEIIHFEHHFAQGVTR